MVTEAMSENMLVKKEFFMIEVNTFCEELPSLAEKNVPPEKQTKKETVPAEISICKFTLENGVDETKHYFIKPGKFPRGFSFLVKDAIEKTHKIDSVQKDDLDCRPDIDDKTCPAENHYKSVVKDVVGLGLMITEFHFFNTEGLFYIDRLLFHDLRVDIDLQPPERPRKRQIEGPIFLTI